MAFALQDRLDHCGERMKALNAETVKLWRDGQFSDEITASPIHLDPATLAGYGLSLDTQRTDWVVDADELVIGGEQTTPRPGDRLVTATEVYAVTPLVAEKPAWRYTTHSHKRIRIETELLGENEAAFGPGFGQGFDAQMT